MTKKNILVLSSWFPSRVFPTLGNFNEKFAEAAAPFNNVFAVHVRADTEMSKPFDKTKVHENGVYKLHYYFPKKKKETPFDRLVKAYRYYKYYQKAFREAVADNGFPDVIHLNVIWPVGLFALRLHRKHGIPYVISENNTAYMPHRNVQRNFFEKRYTRKITRSAALMLPVAPDLKAALKEQGLGSEYEIVPNVINFKHFWPLKEKSRRSKKRVLHISTLDDDQKNISGMLRVAARIKEERTDFEFHIIGDGNRTPHEQYAQKLGLNDGTVIFKGEISTDEVGREMRNADFYVMFSNYETFSIVIAEAWASGIPAVYSKCGGLTEIDEPDFGIQIQRKNEEELYKAWTKMLDESHRYNAERLHRFAKERFSYESVGMKLTDIYRRVSHSSD